LLFIGIYFLSSIPGAGPAVDIRPCASSLHGTGEVHVFEAWSFSMHGDFASGRLLLKPMKIIDIWSLFVILFTALL